MRRAVSGDQIDPGKENGGEETYKTGTPRLHVIQELRGRAATVHVLRYALHDGSVLQRTGSR